MLEAKGGNSGIERETSGWSHVPPKKPGLTPLPELLTYKRNNKGGETKMLRFLALLHVWLIFIMIRAKDTTF